MKRFTYTVNDLLFKLLPSLVFIGGGIALLTNALTNNTGYLNGFNKFMNIFSIFLIIIGVFLAYIHLKDYKQELIFSTKGIQNNNTLYKWQHIANETFSTTETRTLSGLLFRNAFLSFNYQNKSIAINISNFNTHELEVKELIKKYRN